MTAKQTSTHKAARKTRASVHARSFPPDLPATALLTIADVLQYVPVSRTTWFQGVKSGQLPAPHKIGRTAFWKARDIRHLLEFGPKRARRPTPAAQRYAKRRDAEKTPAQDTPAQ